jgi:hypothetical protein
LGGGCEVVLHGTRIHAAAEAYMGLVEAGVGLIPAGGGTKEMIIRANERAEGEEDLDLFHALKPVFENIAMAKVSTSGEEARDLGYLRRADLVAMNLDRLIADAKETALGLVRGEWRQTAPDPTEPSIRVLGQEFSAAAKLAVHMMLRGEYISEYDALVARKLGHILAGGALTSSQLVSEQYVLGQSLAGDRAKWEKNRRWGQSFNFNVTCDSWRDAKGTLWTPNMLVPIDAPQLKLRDKSWLIGTVTYTRDENGQHAQLSLWPPEAFTVEPSAPNMFITQEDVNRNNPTKPDATPPTPPASSSKPPLPAGQLDT